MIVKASQRAGGQHLATHLLNSYDNDRVEVLDVRGAVAGDLHGAFAEWHATAKGTRCQKYLYSMSLNPDNRQGQLRPEQYRDLIARAEAKLGLEGQPRAIVAHVKHGRAHYHVVWSRINPDTLRAVQLSHDRPKLQAVVKAFAQAHALDLPPGMRDGEEQKREKNKARANLAEMQQEERTGESKADRVETITNAWQRAKTGPEFVKALQAQGYTLARGNRRAYVVVDRFGEVHSLSRQLAGVTAKEAKARLAGYDPEKLPDAAQVQERTRKHGETIRPAGDFLKQAEQRRETLKQEQASRRATLDQKRAELDRRQRIETLVVRARIVAENARVQERRVATKPGPVVAAFARVTGFSTLVNRHRARQDAKRETLQTIRLDALSRRQKRERLDFGRHYRALGRVETRETRSLEMALRRELLGRIEQTPGMTQAQKVNEPTKQADTRTDTFNRQAQPGDTGKTDGTAQTVNRESADQTSDHLRKVIEEYRRRHPPEDPLTKKRGPGL